MDAALALVGTKFRLHGRDRDGLDCVGLVALATGLDAPTGYAMRGGSAERWAGLLDASGLRRVEAHRPGDVLLVVAGPGQFHLVVWTGDGVVHADAGLRQVVERPGAVAWPVIGVWRKED